MPTRYSAESWHLCRQCGTFHSSTRLDACIGWMMDTTVTSKSLRGSRRGRRIEAHARQSARAGNGPHSRSAAHESSSEEAHRNYEHAVEIARPIRTHCDQIQWNQPFRSMAAPIKRCTCGRESCSDSQGETRPHVLVGWRKKNGMVADTSDSGHVLVATDGGVWRRAQA